MVNRERALTWHGTILRPFTSGKKIANIVNITRMVNRKRALAWHGMVLFYAHFTLEKHLQI